MALNTQLFNNNKIHLCQGDIVNLEVDAIVNAGNIIEILNSDSNFYGVIPNPPTNRPTDHRPPTRNIFSGLLFF